MQKIFRRLSAALLCLALLAAPALAAEATIRSDYVVIEGENFVADTFCGVDALYNETGRTLFCNELVVAEDGTITDFAMRCPETKLTTVRALHSCGMQTIAAGDSHNDLGMILDSKAGFLFRTTGAIKAEYPELPALETYDELLAAIKAAL